MTTPTTLARSGWTAMVVAVLLVAGACGDDGSDPGDDPEAQPAPDVTAFVEGDFGDLPLPPRADPAGERSETEGVVTRSWFVRNQTPEQVLAFYEEWFADDGVQALVAPAPAGEAAWRGVWPWRDRELHVTSTETTAVDGEEVEYADVVSQLSLELWPDGTSVFGEDVDGRAPTAPGNDG